MKIELLSENEGSFFILTVLDGISLEQHRKSSPSKLEAQIIADDRLKISEGNPLRLSINGEVVFYGFVFSKSISSSNKKVIKLVAYDQLRYLKNKDTYVYENKTLGELVQMIAKDYNLNVGDVSASSYVIPSRTEDNVSLFDIIGNAIDETMQATGKIYYLYDEAGKLMLKNIEDSKFNLLISEDTAGDFDYTSSIDNNSYNKIKLVYEDEKSKKREVYIAQDSKNINKWGVLQFNDTIKTKGAGQSKANALLNFYNRVTKTLSFSKVLGNVKLRAGMSVIVSMNIDNEKINNYMLCDYVKHEFKNNEHLMEIRLRGGLYGS